MTNPIVSFYTGTHGFIHIRLDRVYQLAMRTVKYERYSQYHYSGTRWASGRLKSMTIQLLAQQFIQVLDREIPKVCIALYVWRAEQYSIM